MLRSRSLLTVAMVSSVVWLLVPRLQAQRAATVADYLSPAYPHTLVSARKAERIAWIAYDEGKRNVYTAAAPDFRPVRVTAFLKDDGVDLSSLRISDDGSVVVFVRGHAPNREGWVANPLSDPDGQEQAIWAARTTAPGRAWRVAEGADPQLAPDGSSVLFVRDDQIYRALTSETRPESPRDRGELPFVRSWGTSSDPRWSPDGSKFAFVSHRVDHSFIAIYDMATRTVKYMAPDVDFDTSPTWSPDGRRLAFIRRPGLPFGRQAQPGGRGIGVPPGPAFQVPPAGRGRGGEAGLPPSAAKVPGLVRATFRGGSTLRFMVGDVETLEATPFWENAPDERVFTSVSRIEWAGERVVFTMNNVPDDEWERVFAVSVSGATPRPVLLTTTDGLIEDATSTALSKDGRTLYYCTNAGDIDRRHIWAVPTSGGSPVPITTGDGIETSPVPLASGQRLAVLYADARRPQSVAILPARGGVQQILFPDLPPRFPMDAHVIPQPVTLKAADGFEFYNQLFLPKEVKPGERRPAMIFVHGGPIRQMLLGYHYRHFYHMAYAVNQWLASQGYVVLSVNFRSGIGYGRSFRQAPNRGGQGNSEYQDVVAAGRYLQTRDDVDPERIGIWGLSYGGVLTAQALARNSDIFKAGVDLAGVHLWGSSLDPESISYQSSVIAAIDGWKSPVLLVHGDDDRNVAFQQTTGLVQLLRARDVHYELIVLPDDVHDSLVHARWIHIFERMDAFLKNFLGGRR